MSDPHTPYSSAVTRRTFEKNGEAVLHLTIRRPVFPDLPSVSHFYMQLSERIEKQCAAKVSPAARLYARSHVPCGVSVSFRVTLYSERYLSVLLDVSVFNGFCRTVSCHAQTFAYPPETLLLPTDILSDDARARRRLRRAVFAAVKDAVSNGTVPPVNRSPTSLAASLRLRNCCLVPRGIAFFFDGAAFTDECGSVPLFVIPADHVRDCLRLTF